jgi:hypothetical protein
LIDSIISGEARLGIVDDILKALDRIPSWKRLQGVPSEIDQINERVTALEGKLGGKWPADVCRLCGERSARIGHSTLEKTTVIERWDCEACNNTDFRFHKV